MPSEGRQEVQLTHATGGGSGPSSGKGVWWKEEAVGSSGKRVSGKKRLGVMRIQLGDVEGLGGP